jgi:predicted dehydrogenase
MSDQKMRVVLAGCGGMAGAWLKVATTTPTIEIVGLTDLHRPAAETRAADFHLPAGVVYDTLGDALAKAKPDAVFDVTIPAAHDKVTLQALAAGCHVLGEKPMADSIDKARQMVAAAKRAGRIYAVTQTRRPAPGAITTKQAIEAGAIGQVQEVHCDFYIGARFGGFRAEMDHPLILDMAIHTFDQCRQLTGADPVSVWCKAWNPARSWYRGVASAIAVFDMKLPDGSPVVYSYRGSWTNEGMQTDWNADWRIVGQRGTLHWDGGKAVEAETVADDDDPGFCRRLNRTSFGLVNQPLDGHTFLIREFADCVLSNGTRTPTCPCEDNIKSFAMVEAAVESARTGQSVAIRD